jgi:hypothetical protein
MADDVAKRPPLELDSIGDFDDTVADGDDGRSRGGAYLPDGTVIKFTKTKRWLDKKTATTSPVRLSFILTISVLKCGGATPEQHSGIGRPRPRFRVSESVADDASVRLDGPRASSATAYAWFVWDRAHSGPLVLDRISWVPAPVDE